MERAKLLEILEDWNFWTKPQDTGIPRSAYLERIERLFRSGQVVSLLGVRRGGKSTLMRQYIARLIADGTSAAHTLYVNFEDPRFWGEYRLETLTELYETYLERLHPANTPSVFLDEVQYIPGWEKFVRALHERTAAHLCVSGSTSKLSTDKLGTVLTGRQLPLYVFPLNFREFLHFRRLTITDEREAIAHRAAVKRALHDYLAFGGFPQVVLRETKAELLSSYFNDILARDIIERYAVKQSAELKSLAKFYVSNAASLISFRAVEKFLRIPVSTVERFSGYLSDAYLLSFTKKFSPSLKEQHVQPRKVYVVDPGLRNTVSFRLSNDRGRLLENVVFLHLRHIVQAATEGELFYWRTDMHEVDLVVKRGNKAVQLIQVCADIRDPRTKERETSALFKASEELRCRNLLIITMDDEGKEKIKDKTITYQPLWKWLLMRDT